MARSNQTVDGKQIDDRLIRAIERLERATLVVFDEPARAEQLPGMPIRRILRDSLACQVTHLRPASLQQAYAGQFAHGSRAGTAVSRLGKRSFCSRQVVRLCETNALGHERITRRWGGKPR